jgi:enediyne biosynthesis protein E4
MLKNPLVILFFFLFLSNCRQEKSLFEPIDADDSGINFINQITESDTLNPLRFEYIYNGAGVGVADFNNDGLTDVYFAGNQVSGELYLNKGDFHFENITKTSQTQTKLWCTGVSIVDINQDGWQDIYLSTINPIKGKSSPNLLFINQKVDKNGILIFKEMATEVGLADSSYATQGAFLDYDRDGDLDMFQLTNALESFSRNNLNNFAKDGSSKSTDRLYRNEGIGSDGLPHYVNVGKKSGILEHGWGLGVVVKDINQDGWQDIYVANDFQSNDLMYVNQKDGTFRNNISDILPHQSHNSMGVDMADINNDGLEEISVMDMMPDDNLRQKMMFGGINYDTYDQALRQGYQPQFVRNMLQLNHGMRPDGVPQFGDIGYLAGVNATDWSWSTLFADFDNDGFRDLLITNGYRKDVTNLDFISYRSESTILGIDSARSAIVKKAMEDLQGVYKSNYLFKNNGDLTFTNKAKAWNLDKPSYTNGAAYADFDNDGDLDLVMNNINDKAFVFKNLSQENKDKEASNFLRINLQGNQGNLNGLGTKIKLYASGKLFYDDHTLQRGYKSTVESTVHFGLGNISKIDSLEVIWLSGKRQVLKNILVNKTIDLQERASPPAPLPLRGEFATSKTPLSLGEGLGVRLFQDITADSLLTFLQKENNFVDFKSQPTIPHQLSKLGPGLAVADVNKDGLDDVYITGALRENSYLFIQNQSGKFTKKPFKKTQEEIGALFFDADSDGDDDLYVVSGGKELPLESSNYQDIIYLNDGKGEFSFAPKNALPDTRSSGSCVTASDFDKDGDLDLFVGGRQLPTKYPLTPQSYLLRNDSKGEMLKFTDITNQFAKGLSEIGMVTSALWTDTDNDGFKDLLLAGEWMPITLFQNQKGKSLEKMNIESFKKSTSCWNSLSGGDFDNDGDIDYIAGNMGMNSMYKASPNEPVTMYGKDFDNNENIDPILTHYIQGKEYLAHPRNTLGDQIVATKKLLTTYEKYGKMEFRDIFKSVDTDNAFTAKCESFASVIIENKGNNVFIIRQLPNICQISPMSGTQVFDINQDGNLDILAVGNDYSPESLTGRYDASIGWYLQGNGKGNFKNITLNKSGFCVKGDAKSLVILKGNKGKPMILVGKNSEYLQSILLNNFEEKTPKSKNRKVENYYGNGYLSQSSRMF